MIRKQLLPKLISNLYCHYRRFKKLTTNLLQPQSLQSALKTVFEEESYSTTTVIFATIMGAILKC